MDIFGSIATSFAVAILSLSSAAPSQVSSHSLDLTRDLNALQALTDSKNNESPLDENLLKTLTSEITSAEYVAPKEPVIVPNPSFPIVGSGFLGAPQYVVDLASSASARTGMPVALILAQLKKESGFNPRAVSPTNDHGIAQIHFPKPGVTLEQAYDPSFAINWQANNMSAKFRTYGNWRDALAAYNAGDGGRAKGYGYGYADTVLRMAGI